MVRGEGEDDEGKVEMEEGVVGGDGGGTDAQVVTEAGAEWPLDRLVRP